MVNEPDMAVEIADWESADARDAMMLSDAMTTSRLYLSCWPLHPARRSSIRFMEPPLRAYEAFGGQRSGPLK